MKHVSLVVALALIVVSFWLVARIADNDTRRYAVRKCAEIEDDKTQAACIVGAL